MSGFLYFVEAPSEKPADVETLRNAGIYYAFDDDGFLGMPPTTFLRSGIDGKPGYVFGRDLGKYQMAYHPDQQRWKKIPGTQSHVGIYRDAIPHPESLRRRDFMEGYTTQLADGNNWTVPIARIFNEGESSVCLPRYLDLDDNGKWVPGDVSERYAHIGRIADGFWQAWYPAMVESMEKKDQTIPVEYDDPIGDAVEVLSSNYRISQVEVALLRLLVTRGESVAIGILERLCDCPSAVGFMLQKKTTSDTTPTIAGNAA
jgi:hypothetical protein